MEVGAKNLGFPTQCSKTGGLSEMALHRETRQGVGSMKNTIEQGWALAPEEAPRNTEENLNQKDKSNHFRQNEILNETTDDRKQL